MSLSNRLEDDILSDNTKANYCKQCKQCANWGKSGTPWDNKHDKSNCAVYPYPISMKPTDIINNLSNCLYFEKR